jgi:hypothetical protein
MILCSFFRSALLLNENFNTGKNLRGTWNLCHEKQEQRMETVFRHVGVRRPEAVAAIGRRPKGRFNVSSAENHSHPDQMTMRALLSALSVAVPTSGSARTVNARTGPTAGRRTSVPSAMKTRTGGVMTVKMMGTRTNSTVLMPTDQGTGQAPLSFRRPVPLSSLFRSKISLMFGTII